MKGFYISNTYVTSHIKINLILFLIWIGDVKDLCQKELKIKLDFYLSINIYARIWWTYSIIYKVTNQVCYFVERKLIVSINLSMPFILASKNVCD